MRSTNVNSSKNTNEAPKIALLSILILLIFWVVKLYFLLDEWDNNCPLNYRYFILVTMLVEGFLLMVIMPMICIVCCQRYQARDYHEIPTQEPKQLEESGVAPESEQNEQSGPTSQYQKFIFFIGIGGLVYQIVWSIVALVYCFLQGNSKCLNNSPGLSICLYIEIIMTVAILTRNLVEQIRKRRNSSRSVVIDQQEEEQDVEEGNEEEGNVEDDEILQEEPELI